MGAREVGPWVGEQNPLGKSPLRGNPSPESTYLPTYKNPISFLGGVVIQSHQNLYIMKKNPANLSELFCNLQSFLII